MRCQRCQKPLKKGYYVNGKSYGPECVQEVVGRAKRLGKVINVSRFDESSEAQLELFDDNQNPKNNRATQNPHS